MKLRFGLVITALVMISLMVGLLPGAAQEDAPVDGYYIVSGTGGTFEDNGDGTYTLTLNEVPLNGSWVINQPVPFIGGYDAVVLAAEWDAHPEDLQAQAFLQVGYTVAELIVSAPVYDDLFGDFSFTATVTAVYNVKPLEEGEEPPKGDPEISEEFEAATLAIRITPDFEAGIAEGARILEEEGRTPRTDKPDRPGPPRTERPVEPTPTPGS